MWRAWWHCAQCIGIWTGRRLRAPRMVDRRHEVEWLVHVLVCWLCSSMSFIAFSSDVWRRLSLAFTAVTEKIDKLQKCCFVGRQLLWWSVRCHHKHWQPVSKTLCSLSPICYLILGMNNLILTVQSWSYIGFDPLSTSALTLLVGHQEEHLACKKCWGDDVVVHLDQGANDLCKVQLMPLPFCHLLIHCSPDWFNLSGAGTPWLSWKRGR